MDEKTINIVNLIVAVVALIVPSSIFLLTAPEEMRLTTLIIFGIITITVLVILIISFIYDKYKNIYDNIDTNKTNIKNIKEEISTIEKHLKFKELFSKMDVRLKVLESLLNKKKRGAIDPRIVGWIILAILLYLFIRSVYG